MRSGTKVRFTALATFLVAGVVQVVQAAEPVDADRSPARCGRADTPESGIQGDVAPPTGFNCGLSLVSEVPGGGNVQGVGTCAYVRSGGLMYGNGGTIEAYDISDPANPKKTDEEAMRGGSESLRARVADDRAILVAGRGVYDVRDCTDMKFIGEIPWPSLNATAGATIAATSSHELAISHDGRRVYTGLGAAIAYIDDLHHPETWTVKNYTCQVGKQAGYPIHQGPDVCEVAPFGDYPPQYSHSSDDNTEGTRWYAANQNGDGVSQLEPSTMRVYDQTEPDKLTVLDSLAEVPGHSMSWFRLRDGREFTVSANEGGPGDTCQEHPRPTNLGNAADGYVTEVTDDDLRPAGRVSLRINEPENCDERAASGSEAAISGHAIYNEGRAAFIMVEFGGAGLRVFDLRNPTAPREVAYYNRGGADTHSGLYHYDPARGLLLQSGGSALRILELQPQVIRALGLPKPTDKAYPRYPTGRPAQGHSGPAAARQPERPALGHAGHSHSHQLHR